MCWYCIIKFGSDIDCSTEPVASFNMFPVLWINIGLVLRPLISDKNHQLLLYHNQRLAFDTASDYDSAFFIPKLTPLAVEEHFKIYCQFFKLLFFWFCIKHHKSIKH